MNSQVIGLIPVRRIDYGIRAKRRHDCERYLQTGNIRLTWCKSCSGETLCGNAGKSTDSLMHCKAAPQDWRKLIGDRIEYSKANKDLVFEG